MSAAGLTMLLGLSAFGLVAHALRPFRRPTPIQLFGLFASWIPIELPLHVLALLGGTVLFCISAGGLDDWPGWIGMMGFTAAAVGLLHLSGGARQVVDRVNDALEALPQASEPIQPYHWARLWLPTSHYQPSVITDLNRAYTESGHPRHRLDVYRSKTHRGPSPVVLQLHGGGWIIGHKRQQGRPLLTHLAANGFVCVAANYRLSPKATFPEHIIDVKRAIAWIRAHIAEYGGDPNFIVLTGGSAGAHLASLAALTPNYAPWQPGFEDADTTIQACVPLYGVYDCTNRGGFFPVRGVDRMFERHIMKAPLATDRPRYEAASPLYRLTPDAPPFLAIHGIRDSFAPVEQYREFLADLRDVSTSPVYGIELPWAQHAFDVFPSVRVKGVLEGIRRFVEAVSAANSVEERASSKLGAPETRIGVDDETDGNGF